MNKVICDYERAAKKENKWFIYHLIFEKETKKKPLNLQLSKNLSLSNIQGTLNSPSVLR